MHKRHNRKTLEAKSLPCLAGAFAAGDGTYPCTRSSFPDASSGSKVTSNSKVLSGSAAFSMLLSAWACASSSSSPTLCGRGGLPGIVRESILERSVAALAGDECCVGLTDGDFGLGNAFLYKGGFPPD